MSLQGASGANYLELATASPWVQTGRAFTVMAWFYQTSLVNQWNPGVSSYDGTANSWELGSRSDSVTGSVMYFTWSTAGTYYGAPSVTAATGNITGMPVIAANEWHHVAVRYDLNRNATTPVQFDMWLDGRLVGASAATTAVAIASGSRKIRIKQSSDNAGVTFPGSVADVRLFEGILSGADIQRNRMAPMCPKYLYSRCILDLPLQTMPGSAVWAVDTGPKRLGSLTAVGTVAYAFDPPIQAAPYPLLDWQPYLWGSGAGAGAPATSDVGNLRAAGILSLAGIKASSTVLVMRSSQRATNTAAHAGTTVLTPEVEGRVGAVGVKGSLTTLTPEIGGRGAATGVKGGLTALGARATGWLTEAATHAGTSSLVARATGWLTEAATHAGTTNPTARVASRAFITGIHASVTSAILDTSSRGAVTGTKASVAAVDVRSGARWGITAAKAASGTLSLVTRSFGVLVSAKASVAALDERTTGLLTMTGLSNRFGLVAARALGRLQVLASSAPASSDTLSLFGIARLSAQGVKSSSSPVMLDGSSRTVVVGVKSGVTQVVTTVRGRMAVTGARASSSSVVMRGIAWLQESFLVLTGPHRRSNRDRRQHQRGRRLR